MRHAVIVLIAACCCATFSFSQTADELVAKNIQATGFLRTTQIQKDQVIDLFGGEALCLDTVGYKLDGELFLDEALVQKFGQRRVVFCDKNTHERTL